MLECKLFKSLTNVEFLVARIGRRTSLPYVCLDSEAHPIARVLFSAFVSEGYDVSLRRSSCAIVEHLEHPRNADSELVLDCSGYLNN